MKAVIKRIAATINKIKAKTPETTWVKNNTRATAAMSILTNLSMYPMFDFIILSFEMNRIINCQLHDSVFLLPPLPHRQEYYFL